MGIVKFVIDGSVWVYLLIELDECMRVVVDVLGVV